MSEHCWVKKAKGKWPPKTSAVKLEVW